MKKRFVYSIVLAQFLLGFQVHAAENASAFDVMLKEPVVNITVKDANGKDFAGAAFDLYDSDQKKVASWISGSEEKAVLYDEKLTIAKNGDDVEGSFVYADYYSDFKSLRSIVLSSETKENFYRYMDYYNDKAATTSDCTVQFGTTYQGSISYKDIERTDLVIPAGTIRVWNQSVNSDAAHYQITEVGDLKDNCKDATWTDFTATPGKYEIFYGARSNGCGGNLYVKMTVSDHEVTYRKIRIHLADYFGGNFAENGDMYSNHLIEERYGVKTMKRGDCGKDYIGDFGVWSGSLLQMPPVDENGDIEFYVSNDENSFKLYSDFYWKGGGGGGSNLSSGVYVTKDIQLNCPSIPENGITLKGLGEGTYTIKPADNAVVKDGNQFTSKTFTVENTGAIQKVEEVAYAVNTEENKKENQSVSIEKAEQVILDKNIDKRDGELSPFSLLKLQIKTGKKKSKYYTTLSWKRIKNADGYIIYGSRCGKYRRMKKIDTITNNKTTKWSQKNLKKGTYYKYIVVAYKGENVISTSKSVHATTPDGKKGNPTGISLKKKNITLKVGKKQKIKAKVIAKKKYSLHIAEFRYESTNNKVAKVSEKGVIKAVAKGKATIYVYTQNGLYKKVKVKVK